MIIQWFLHKERSSKLVSYPVNKKRCIYIPRNVFELLREERPKTSPRPRCIIPLSGCHKFDLNCRNDKWRACVRHVLCLLERQRHCTACLVVASRHSIFKDWERDLITERGSVGIARLWDFVTHPLTETRLCHLSSNVCHDSIAKYIVLLFQVIYQFATML